jgi:hypothetical protein
LKSHLLRPPCRAKEGGFASLARLDETSLTISDQFGDRKEMINRDMSSMLFRHPQMKSVALLEGRRDRLCGQESAAAKTSVHSLGD